MLIAQLSDPHVCAPGLLYKGVADSNQLFSEAIEHLHRLDRQPDLVLITGDLTDEGRPEEYLVFRELIRALKLPYLLMPGNHDHRLNFRQALADVGYLPNQGALHYCIDDHPLRIVALDSCQPGKHHGLIDDEGLRWLAQTLSGNRRKPTLLAIHHPPFESGIKYIDDYFPGQLLTIRPINDPDKSYQIIHIDEKYINAARVLIKQNEKSK
jgi:3',5'-cyclic AMP phosphodiesterase CpdA